MADELVTVRSYFNQTDAYLARSRLESAGIPTFLADENMVNTNWFYSIAMGGIRLQVRAEDVGAALEILDDKAGIPLEAAEADQVLCPKCGSSDTARGPSSTLGLPWLGCLGTVLVYVMPSFLVSLPLFLAAKWRYRCKSCGHVWQLKRLPAAGGQEGTEKE
jgi:hypothetical protein